MKDLVFSRVHSSWVPIFDSLTQDIELILSRIDADELAPDRALIFRAFERDIDSISCVIVGQDPYPTKGLAMGLSFSVPSTVRKLPPSLKNIFVELSTDQAIPNPTSGDLSPWMESGVMLLNRVLTTKVGESNAHHGVGWQKITNRVAQELGDRGVVAVLWGAQAQELSPFFKETVSSVHPSPLSAYRGFFGSKPFTHVNDLLISQGRPPITWSL